MKQVTFDITEETPVLTFTDIGIPGPQGIQGIQGEKGDAFEFTDFTPPQLLQLKGDKGEKGDSIVGPRGLKGDRGTDGPKGNTGDKLTFADLTDTDKDDLSKGVQPQVDKAAAYAGEAKVSQAAALQSALDAEASAQKALDTLLLTIKSGGLWDPSGSSEYPLVPTVDTLWIINLPSAGAHTFTSGILTGKTVKSADWLFYDVTSTGGQWEVIKLQLSAGIQTLNGKSGTAVTLIPSDIGALPDYYIPDYSVVANKPQYFPTSWANVASKPAQASRWPTYAEVTGKPSLFSGNYRDLLGIPNEFTPKAHSQDWNTILNVPDYGKRWPSYGEVTGTPDLVNTYRRLDDSFSQAEMDARYVNHNQQFSESYNDLKDKPNIPSAPSDVGALGVLDKAADSALLNGHPQSQLGDSNTIAQRDASGDLTARMFRMKYPTQSSVGSTTAGFCFRVNSTNDNFMRIVDRAGMLDWMGRVHDSTRFLGKTLDTVKAETRAGLIPDTRTVNGKRLNANIRISAADVGLGNVPNYASTNSPSGTSTTLLATQRAAYDASAAPRLADDRKRKITKSTNAPTGGSNGDLWIQL